MRERRRRRHAHTRWNRRRCTAPRVPATFLVLLSLHFQTTRLTRSPDSCMTARNVTLGSVATRSRGG